jgi:hypothetical protein
MTLISGGYCDLIHVYAGTEVVQTHQLVDRRTWRTSTVAQADEETDDEGNPPAASALQDRPALQRAGATP